MVVIANHKAGLSELNRNLIGTLSELYQNLIGTLSELHRRLSELCRRLSELLQNLHWNYIGGCRNYVCTCRKLSELLPTPCRPRRSVCCCDLRFGLVAFERFGLFACCAGLGGGCSCRAGSAWLLPSAACGVCVVLNCACGCGSSQNSIALVWCLFKSSRNYIGHRRLPELASGFVCGSPKVRLWFVCGSSKVRR